MEGNGPADPSGKLRRRGRVRLADDVGVNPVPSPIRRRFGGDGGLAIHVVLTDFPLRRAPQLVPLRFRQTLPNKNGLPHHFLPGG